MSDVIQNRSRAFRKALALALALPLAAAALPAQAQDPGPPERARAEAGDRMEPGQGRDRMDRGYRHHAHGWDRDRAPRRWHGRIWGERLAIRLAAAEQAAGIKVAQLDAWRTFTAALIDFVTPMPLRPGETAADTDEQEMMGQGATAPDEMEAAPEAAEQAAPEGGASGAARPDGMRPSDILDRMIARAEDRAAKAERLKTAKAQLEAVLEPGQRETLERFMMPPRRMGGRR